MKSLGISHILHLTKGEIVFKVEKGTGLKHRSRLWFLGEAIQICTTTNDAQGASQLRRPETEKAMRTDHPQAGL